MMNLPAKNVARVTGLPRKHFSAPTSTNNGRNSNFILFTNIATFLIPKNVSKIPLIEIKGGDGTFESGTHNYIYGYATKVTPYYQIVYDAGGSNAGTGTPSYNNFSSGDIPNDYCTTATVTQGSGFTRYDYTCYEYSAAQMDAGNYKPASKGDDTVISNTAFTSNLSGPGGDAFGGIAKVYKFYNVSVTPGSNLGISIMGINGYVKLYMP